MQPVIIGIIIFAAVSALIFIIVVIWGIKGLSKKDDIKPVHIHLPPYQTGETPYAGGYPYEPLSYGPPMNYGQNLQTQHPYASYPEAYDQNYSQYPYSQVIWEESGTPEEEHRPPPPRIVPKKPRDEIEQQESYHPEGTAYEHTSEHYVSDHEEQYYSDNRQGVPAHFRELATEGVQEVIRIVEDYNITAAAGYPAFASSEQKALTPADLARQDFYNIRDYMYTANDVIPHAGTLVEGFHDVPLNQDSTKPSEIRRFPTGPDEPAGLPAEGARYTMHNQVDYAASPIQRGSPSMHEIEYDEIHEDGDIPLLQTLPSSKTPGPVVEKRGKAFKHTMEESTKCNVCLGFIKTGFPLITCVCSKSYHVSCASRMGKCPICSQDLLDYDDRIGTEQKIGDSFEASIEKRYEIGNSEEKASDKYFDHYRSPVEPTMAKLTEQQKEKLRELLSRYDTNRQYPDLVFSDL